MEYLKQAKQRFKEDRFASDALGAVIESLDEDGAVCSVELGTRHLNGIGEVMGGAIFTLADFAFAVATNFIEDTTVTQTSQITYLGRAKGKKLIATANKVRAGRSICFYTVDVKDELGNDVALVTVTGFKKSS